MSNIRVTYSGFIAFATSLVSIITGLSFMVIITRTLSIEEYGTWGLITSLIVYGIIFTSNSTFWILRETARESKTEKTGLISSGFWSLVGILSYLLAVNILFPQSDIDMTILFFAVILVPVNIVQATISAINVGWKPQFSSYGMFVAEIIKIPLALLFVYYLDLGIMGVIISLFISLLSSIVFQIIIAKERLQGPFEFSIVKKWFKLSWISLYPRISGILYTSDVIIISIITGSVEIIAYYAAALVVANIVSHSGVISQSVYPKLLGGGERTIAIKNVTYVLYIAIPILSLSIIFAEAGLIILNPAYKAATLVVIFLSLKIFLNMFGGVFKNFLTGIETVDVKENATVTDYIKSKLFTIPTFRTIQFAMYLVVLSTVLISMVPIMSEIELLITWSIIAMVFQLPFLIFLLLKIQKTFGMNFESISILKYIIIGFCVFGFLSFMIDEFLILSEELVEIIPNVLLFTLGGISLYILITYIIDSKARNLLNGIIKEINQRKK